MPSPIRWALEAGWEGWLLPGSQERGNRSVKANGDKRQNRAADVSRATNGSFGSERSRSGARAIVDLAGARGVVIEPLRKDTATLGAITLYRQSQTYPSNDRQAGFGARMSAAQKLAVRQIDSAPLLSDQRNWSVGHVIAATGGREGALADFGLAIAQNECSRPG